MSKRRVVVTGMGAVTPLANSVSETWTSIVAGKSGVSRITAFDVSDMPSQIAGVVKNLDPLLSLHPKETRKLDGFVQVAAEVGRQAIEDSGLEIDDAIAPRAGVAIGSGIGGLNHINKNYQRLIDGGPRRVSPFFIPGGIINMCAGIVAIKQNLRGPNISIATACTTGTHNIGIATRLIQYGDADVMVAGGVEMANCRLTVAGFSIAKALSRRNDAPEQASRPWDRDRDGFVLAEGGAVLVLEEYEHAKQRGAKIYGEIVGFAMSGDAYHYTAPDPEAKGFVLSMGNAIKDAGIDLTAIDYINAHGTSTLAGDHLEALAVKQVFGDHAHQLAVSSTKSMTGHMLGAAGSVEAIFTLLAMRDNIAPPTINLDNPSEGCDLNFVAHQAQERQINIALSNSFGFGGTNASLIFKKI